MLIHRRTELGALDLPIGALIDAIKPGQRDRLNESQLFWEALNSWGVRLDIPPELQDTIIAAFGPASASLSEAVTDDVLTLLARTARAEVGRVHLGPHAVALVLRYPQRYMDRQLAHLREWLKLLRGGAPLFEGAGETERIRTGPEPA